MANNDKENKIKKFTKEAIGKTLNQFNKEIGIADLVEINKNQDRILNGILSQVNDENTEKTEKSNIITLDNSTDGIVELKEIQGDTNVNVSKIEEMPITHDIGDKEGNVFTLNEIPKGAISIGEIQGNTMVNCNKDDKKELVLMKDLSTEGYSNITLTEGVDGGLVDIALEGNTMVNVCDQKDPVAITKSYTVETGNHVALQGEYDGKCRPVVTGNTLVNLYKTCKPYISDSSSINVTNFNKIIKNNYIKVQNDNLESTTWRYIAFSSLSLNLFKPSTTYTLIFEKLKGVSSFSIRNTGGNANYILSPENISVKNDTLIYKVTTASNFTIDAQCLYFYLNVGTSIDVEISNPIILEGDYTNKPTPEYFEGLQSSFEDKVVPENLAGVDSVAESNSNYMKYFKDNACTKCTVIADSNDTCLSYRDISTKSWVGLTSVTSGKNVYEAPAGMEFYAIQQARSLGDFTAILVEGDYTNYDFSDYDSTKAGKYRVDYVVTGKNKFDGKLEKGSLDDVGINMNNDNYRRSINYIPVVPNTRYEFRVNDEKGYGRLFFYDKNKLFISSSLNNNNDILITPNNCYYIRFRIDMVSYLSIYPIDENTIKYQLEVGDTATPYEPYKEYTKTFYLNSPLLEGDTIEQQGDNVVHVHRYKKVVLDGSVDEVWQYNEKYFYIPGFSDRSNTTNSPCISNIGCTVSHTVLDAQSGYGVNMSYGFRVNLPNINAQNNTLNEFKQWLQSNPITVAYKLLTPQYEVISQNDTILCDSYVNGHLDVDSVVPIEKVDFLHFEKDLTYLYANTQYTVQFTSDKAVTVDITLGGTKLLAQSIVIGLNKITITTPETLADNKLIISGVGANIMEVVVTDTDREFSYFEGMKSVGECEDLEVVSSNSDGTLSNTQTLTHEPLRAVGNIKDRYVLIDGKWYIERNCGVRAYQEGDIDNYITDMINTVYPLITPTYEPIDYNPFTVYSDITHISNNSTIPCNMAIKNTGYNCLLKPSTTYTVSSNLGLSTVTTPSTLTEDCLRFYDTDTSTVTTMKDVTILEGDYTTNGKPLPSHFSGIESAFEQEYDEEKGKYKVKIRIQNEDASKENYIEFYIDEPLRGIGDTKDKVYVKNDKVVVERNCGSYTFDGSEKFGGFTISDNGVPFAYTFALTDKKIGKDNYILCNRLRYFDNYAFSSSMAINGDTNTAIYIMLNKSIRTLEKFKQWLQQNPTTVVYQLAEPTYEEVEYSSNRLILDTFNNESFNNSTLFLDTTILPKLSFKPLYEELVYVKNSTKYYIQFNAVGSGEVVINLGGAELTTEIVEGYNCIPITTPSESTNLMTMIGQGITISEVVVSEVICGGYYKGLQSCFEEHMENGKYRVLLRGIALDGSKVNGIKLYINEPLRGVEDVKDRLCIKNGKLMVERRCGELIINETNSYGISDNNPYYPSVLRIFYSKNSIQNYNDGYCLCDTLPSYGFLKEDVIGIGHGNGLDIHLPLPTTSTLDEAREYLKNNPLKIVYQLAEPTYEEATNEYGLPIVLEGYENGIVYIDSAVIPTTSIKYTSNNVLATTLSETEGQNNSTQDDINMNVVTYMMDIDMLLTEKEMENDISVMAVRRDNNNENMLDRMSEEDKKVYQDNTVVMLEKMITAQVLEKEDIKRRINMYYNKNRISKEQYNYLKSLL